MANKYDKILDAYREEDGGSGSGTVTSVSVVTANGISGSVATATTTPAITLNITALDATKIANGAVTDTEFQYLDGVTSPIQTQLNAKGVGSVTSVAQTVPTGLTISGSPVTTTGTLAIALDTGYVIPLQSTLDAKALGATTITIAGTANQITSSAGAQDLSANRTWTLSLPADVIIPTVLTVPNTGLHLLDTNASHDLIIKPGSNITADRTFTITTGDTDMIVDFTAVIDEYILAYDVATNTWRGVVASGGGASTALDNLASVAINTSLISDTTNTDDLGSSSVLWRHTYTTDIELGHATDNTLTASGGVLSIEGVVIPTISSTSTLTNKRITKRVVTAADATSVTPNTDSADWTYQLNTQATGTLTINADAGTPTNCQAWGFKIKSTNVQTFSWDSEYVGGTVALPTVSSGGSNIDYFTFIYDTVDSKWHFTGQSLNF